MKLHRNVIFDLIPSFLILTNTDAVYISGIKRLFQGKGNLLDSSPFEQHATPDPASAVITFPTDTVGPQNSRQVINFDGSGLATGSALELPGGDAPRSMVGWFKSTDGSSWSTAFAYGSGVYGRAFVLYSIPDMALDYWYIDEGVNPIVTPVVNKWYHVAILWDGTKNICYVDGQFVKEGTPDELPDTNVDSSARTSMGGRVDGNGFLKGSVADFAIFDRVLTGDEILSIYNDPNGLEGTMEDTEAPSELPSLVSSIDPTFTPTVSPTITGADQFEWDISIMRDANYSSTESAIDMSFNISNRAYTIDVLDSDCITKVEDALHLTETVTGIGDGFKEVDISLHINQIQIEGSSSEIWTNTTSGGEIEFCILTSLFLTSAEENLINFLETKAKVNVDKTSGFEVDSIQTFRTAASVAQENDINIEEAIDVYQCNNEFTAIESPPPLAQGNVLQLCVHVNDTSSIYAIGEIFALNITQGNKDPLEIISSNGNDILYPSITEVIYQDGANKVGKVKFQLLGSFFDQTAPADLDISGVVHLVLKTRRRRLYFQDSGVVSTRSMVEGSEHEWKSRKLQAEEFDNTDGTFALKVSLEDVNDASYAYVKIGCTFMILAISCAFFALW
jgi:hypothetical protein